MKIWWTRLVTILSLSFIVAASYPAFAAPAKCNAELRKCNSHCNLGYESKRALRVCRDRCKDTFYACKARPN
jgi:hypothetical protein